MAQLACICNAQSDSFTQVGTAQCRVFPGPSWRCDPVKFNSQFGGTPSVAVSVASFYTTGVGNNNSANVVNVGVGADSITSQGFLPVATAPGGTAPANINVTWIAVGPVLLNTTATARYIVMAVLYAPPGTTGGSSKSSVQYSTGTTSATTTAASQSFKSTNSLSVSISGAFGGAEDSYTFSNSDIDSQSLLISKAKNQSIQLGGPSTNSIDHDEDLIVVVLNPTINLSLSPISVSWSPTSSENTPILMAVSQLKGIKPFPADVLAAIQAAGVTQADFQNILARDPFTDPNYVPDPNRFSYVTSMYYLAPLNPGDPVLVQTVTLTDTSASTAGNELDDTYSVALSLSDSSGPVSDLAKLDLKDTNTWEWTNKTSRSTTDTSNVGAVATIGGPSAPYDGPSECDIYVDTLYHTFAFTLVPAGSRDTTLEGKVVDSRGKPMANASVVLVENGVSHPTVTNAKGQYVFYVPWRGSAHVVSGFDVQAAPQDHYHSSKQITLHPQIHIQPRPKENKSQKGAE